MAPEERLMKREEITLILDEIFNLHVKQSYIDRVKKHPPGHLPDSVLEIPALAALNALPAAAKENLITELTQLTWPETLAVDDVKNFKIFLITTLLARALLFSKSIHTEWSWILHHLERLQDYWNVQGLIFEVQKENPSFYQFVRTLPPHHHLHFQFIEELQKDFYLKYKQYREYVVRDSYDLECRRQLAHEKIYLCQGPLLKGGSEYLADFIGNIHDNDVRIVFALGNVGLRNNVFYFPKMLFEPKTNFAVDFFNYFAKEHTDMIALNMRYQEYGLPAIRLNPQRGDTYHADIYCVKTKPLEGYNSSKAAGAVNGCNLNSYELSTACMQEKPRTTVVHNFDVNDNNPGNFTDAQLKLIVDSLIKAKVEGFAVTIHCMGGYGRTGMLAFIAARMFCPEMPVKLEEALIWLRTFREGLIITVQQLLCAEEASQRVLALLAPCQTTEGYDWKKYYIANNLASHLPQITKPIQPVEEKSADQVSLEALLALGAAVVGKKKSPETSEEEAAGSEMDSRHKEKKMRPDKREVTETTFDGSDEEIVLTLRS